MHRLNVMMRLGASLFLALFVCATLLEFVAPQSQDTPLWQVALVDEDEVESSESKAAPLLPDEQQGLASAYCTVAPLPHGQLARPVLRALLPACVSRASINPRAPPIV